MLALGSTVSIEIGSQAVRVAQLIEGRGRIRVVKFAEQSMPDGYRWEIGADRQPVVEAVQSALAKAGIRARRAVFTIPRSRVTARISAFPPADRASLERVVEQDLADHIPFPVEEVVVDLQPLGPSAEDPGLTDVLVIAAQRDLIREYLTLAEEVGIQLAALTVDALALYDLAHLAEREPLGTTVTVLIGPAATTINVSEQGRLKLTRSVAVGGLQLVRAIQEDLGLTPEEAEREKQTQGLGLLEREPRPARTAAWRDSLLGDIRRSALSFGPGKVSSIVLAGPEASLPGMKEALEAEFDVAPTSLAASELFPRAEFYGGPPEAADHCPVAIGQALRALGHSAWTVSLVPREVLQTRRARRLRRTGMLAALVVVAGLASMYALAARSLARKTEVVGQLKGKAKAAAVQLKQAEELNAERRLLQEQLDQMEPVRLNRYATLELLNTIAFYAPDDIVLSRFIMRPDRSLEIQGAAPSSTAAAELQQALGTSPFVTDARLLGVVTTSERGQAGQEVNFTMQIRLWAPEEAGSPTAVLSRRGGAK